MTLRLDRSGPRVKRRKKSTSPGAKAVLRPLTRADRPALERIFQSISLFSSQEVAVALEVLDASFVPEQTDYHTLGAEVGGRLAGWVCWGATPCTVGTYDMYWIAVDPSVHGAGVGSALVSEMENRLKGIARLIVVETGGRRDYEATRSFYLARGYEQVARVPDFYAPGDDQIVFSKKVGG
ncbi:MAG: N-acetyltransferase [Gemmatimonadota bacterium]